MRSALLAVFFAVLMLTGGMIAQNDAAKSAAQKSGLEWLGVIDSGKYAESYDTAAAMFKAAITKQDWSRAVGAARGPLGAVGKRTPASATYTTTLPGAPDGDYVVLVLNTSFENKKEAVETLTMALDKDGKWRAAGYFIK